MLKAYSVYCKDCRSEHAELVFHYSAKEAKALAWKKPYGEFGCSEWIDIRVSRLKEADLLANGKDDPFVCRDDAMFREAGWRGEDCDTCSCCDKTDLSFGFEPMWAICPECGRCGECGHAVDCKEKESYK